MKARRSMLVLLVATSIIYLSSPSRILAHWNPPDKHGGGCAWPYNPPEQPGQVLVNRGALPMMSLEQISSRLV